MGELLATYLGPNWQRFSKLADVELVVDGTTFPAHLSTLAKHSEVILDMAEAEAAPGNGRGKLQLVEPFQDKSQAGVLLFLKCCYKESKIKQLMGESLKEELSEVPLHELLLLAHHFQATALLAECEEHMSDDFVAHLQPGNLTKWVGTAERCGCGRLQQLLTEAVGKQLAEEHSKERVKELIEHLSPDSAAGIIASAWDVLAAGGSSGAPRAAHTASAAAAAAELQAAVDAARAEAAAANLRADDAAAAARAAAAEDVAQLTARMDVLPRLFAQWLPPELTLVSMEQDAFIVEWNVVNFSTLQPQVLDSPGFGPGQAWKVRMFPRGSDGKGEAVGLFLTFAGAATVQVKYAVTLVNQKDVMANRTMESVSMFVPRSQEDTWGTPQFISRLEMLDPAVGFSPEDTVKVRVSVAPPPL